MLGRLPGALPLAAGPYRIHHIHDGEPCSNRVQLSAHRLRPCECEGVDDDHFSCAQLVHEPLPSAMVAACCKADPSFSGPAKVVDASGVLANGEGTASMLQSASQSQVHWCNWHCGDYRTQRSLYADTQRMRADHSKAVAFACHHCNLLHAPNQCGVTAIQAGRSMLMALPTMGGFAQQSVRSAPSRRRRRP